MNLFNNNQNLKFRSIYLWAVVILTSFLPNSPLLGSWESLTYFSTFAVKNASFDLFYPPRANIGGQGYWPLDLSRTFIEAFDLPFNIFWIRLPSIALGIISLYIFFKICNRFINEWLSFTNTCLLASNPTFHYFQHSMTINMASFCFLLLLIYRILILIKNHEYSRNYLFVGISFALCMSTYGPAKIFAFLLAIYYIASKSIYKSWTKKRLVYLSLPTIFLLLNQQYWKYENLKNLYLSKDAEIILNQSDNQYVSAVILNFKILIETLFLNGGDNHSNNQYSLLIADRYPIINSFWMTLLLLIGILMITLYHVKKMKQYSTLIELVIVTGILALLAVILSASYEPLPNSQSSQLSTVSNFRMFYLLIPVHLLLVALLAIRNKFQIRTFFTILIFMSIIINVMDSYKDTGIFHNWLNQKIADKNLNDEIAELIETIDIDLALESNSEHLIQHKKYYQWSEQIADKIQKSDLSVVNIAKTDISCFSDKPLIQSSYRNLNDLNFHSFFLAIYLSEAIGDNASVGLTTKYSMKSQYIDGKKGIFPSKIFKGENEYSYFPDEQKDSFIWKTFNANNLSNVVIVTSKQEFDYVISLLDEKNLGFIEVSDNLTCRDKGQKWYYKGS